MRVLLCLLPLVVAAAPVADRPPGMAVGKCADATLRQAKRDEPVRMHPLNQEPGASQEITVLHYDADHCVKPIIVRDNVGGASK